MKIKNDTIFLHFYGKDVPYDEEGAEQFFIHQSEGIVPDNPSPYYTALSEGKWAFDILHEELRQSFLSQQDWPGLALLREEWKGRPDILDKLLDWMEVRHDEQCSTCGHYRDGTKYSLGACISRHEWMKDLGSKCPYWIESSALVSK